MKKKERFIPALLLVVVGILLLSKVGLERKMESPQTNVSAREVISWLAETHPEEAFLGGLAVSLGFKEIVTDFLFLQVIQYFGDWKETREVRFHRTYPMLWTIAKISPHFIDGYALGSLVMEDTGHTNEAILYLDEGIKNNPSCFQLIIYRDFMLRLLKTAEYEKAIEGIKKVISLPGHPPILERILAFAYEKNGQRKASLLQWKKVFLSTTDPHIEKICQNNMKRLLDILIEKEGRKNTLLWLRKEMPEEYQILKEAPR